MIEIWYPWASYRTTHRCVESERDDDEEEVDQRAENGQDDAVEPREKLGRAIRIAHWAAR